MTNNEIYISQADFAKRWNNKYPDDTITRQYVGKLVNIIHEFPCDESKKIPYDKCLKILEDKKSAPERQNQREANNRKKNIEKQNDIFCETMIPENSIANLSENDKDIFWQSRLSNSEDNKTIEDFTDADITNDKNLFTNENLKELEEYLKEAKSVSQKVQIIKDFWTGKINKQKYLEGEKELIPMVAVKKAIDLLLTPLNHYLNDQANNLKNHFPELPNEVMEWLGEENNRQKQQLRGYDWKL